MNITEIKKNILEKSLNKELMRFDEKNALTLNDMLKLISEPKIDFSSDVSWVSEDNEQDKEDLNSVQSKNFFLDDIRFNIDGSIKEIWNGKVSPKDQKDYWQKRLKYFSTNNYTADENFEPISLIKIIRDEDNLFKITSGLESFVYALKNKDTKVFIRQENIEEANITNMKLLGETISMNINSFEDFVDAEDLVQSKEDLILMDDSILNINYSKLIENLYNNTPINKGTINDLILLSQENQEVRKDLLKNFMESFLKDMSARDISGGWGIKYIRRNTNQQILKILDSELLREDEKKITINILKELLWDMIDTFLENETWLKQIDFADKYIGEEENHLVLDWFDQHQSVNLSYTVKEDIFLNGQKKDLMKKSLFYEEGEKNKDGIFEIHIKYNNEMDNVRRVNLIKKLVKKFIDAPDIIKNNIFDPNALRIFINNLNGFSDDKGGRSSYDVIDNFSKKYKLKKFIEQYMPEEMNSNVYKIIELECWTVYSGSLVINGYTSGKSEFPENILPSMQLEMMEKYMKLEDNEKLLIAILFPNLSDAKLIGLFRPQYTLENLMLEDKRILKINRRGINFSPDTNPLETEKKYYHNDMSIRKADIIKMNEFMMDLIMNDKKEILDKGLTSLLNLNEQQYNEMYDSSFFTKLVMNFDQRIKDFTVRLIKHNDLSVGQGLKVLSKEKDMVKFYQDQFDKIVPIFNKSQDNKWEELLKVAYKNLICLILNSNNVSDIKKYMKPELFLENKELEKKLKLGLQLASTIELLDEKQEKKVKKMIDFSIFDKAIVNLLGKNFLHKYDYTEIDQLTYENARGQFHMILNKLNEYGAILDSNSTWVMVNIIGRQLQKEIVKPEDVTDDERKLIVNLLNRYKVKKELGWDINLYAYKNFENQKEEIINRIVNDNFYPSEYSKKMLFEIYHHPVFETVLNNPTFMSGIREGYSEGISNFPEQVIPDLYKRVIRKGLTSFQLIDMKNLFTNKSSQSNGIADILRNPNFSMKILTEIESIYSQDIHDNENEAAVLLMNFKEVVNGLDDELKNKPVVLEKIGKILQIVKNDYPDASKQVHSEIYDLLNEPLATILKTKFKEENKTLMNVINEINLKKEINKQVKPKIAQKRLKI